MRVSHTDPVSCRYARTGAGRGGPPGTSLAPPLGALDAGLPALAAAIERD